MARTDHLHTAGQGPRVLLVQGTGVAGRAWAPQVDALRDAFELAWYDAPGVGGRPGSPGTLADMSAEAIAVLDTLGWPSAFVVGHSLGGVIALQLAHDAPDRVDGLGLLCTFCRGRATLSLDPRTLWIQTRTALGPKAWRRRAFYELVTHPDRPPTEANIAELEAVFGRPLYALPPGTPAQMRALLSADHTGRASQIRCPALVVSGAHDRVAPVAEGRRLADLLGAPLEVLDGGHAVTIQQADVLNGHLRAHLEAWSTA